MELIVANIGTALPMVIKREAEPLNDADDCLTYIRTHAPSQFEANARTIAVGILYVLLLTVLAKKGPRKRFKFIKSELAAAFREPAGANSTQKSKAYKLSGLSIQIARHPEILPKVCEVGPSGTVRDAVELLTKHFREQADSIAGLARRFGAQDRRQDGPTEEIPESSFLTRLKALTERALVKNQPIPFVASTLHLKNAAASPRDICDLMKKLIPDASEAELAELVDICNRTIAVRAEQRDNAPA